MNTIRYAWIGCLAVLCCLFVGKLYSRVEASPSQVVLPKFVLPWDKSENGNIHWTSGPHMYPDTNTRGLYPSGLGSGIDFAKAGGSSFRVLAMATGTVEDASCDYGITFGFGCVIAIRHFTGGTVMLYAHLRQGSFKVKIGDKVSRGDHIADAGSSGTDNLHLHLDLRDGSSTCYAKGNDPVIGTYDACIKKGGQIVWGNPIGWDDLIELVDGYRIGGYIVDGDGLYSFNYDGSAVKGDVKIIDNFKYIDSGFTRTNVIARVHTSFECNPDNVPSCEPLVQDLGNPTQFAIVGDGGQFPHSDYSFRSSAMLASQPLKGGLLSSSNVENELSATSTPVAPTPTRSSTTPTPVATSGAPVSCSNIGWFNQSIAHTFSEKNCLGDSSWNSQHEPNGPGASRQKSIYVPVGKVLKIYQHDNRGGRTECLSGSFPDLSAIGWENGIQSAYLENGPCFQPTATVQPAPVREVKFYNETNFEGGRAFTLGEGNHYPRDLGHGEKFHKFESMRICEGCVVNVYDSVGEDRCWVYDEDKVGNHGLYGQDAVRIQISTNANPICTPWHPKWTSPQEGSVYAVGQDVVIGWRAGDEFSDRFTVEVWHDGVLGYNQVRSTNTTTTLRNVQVGSYKVRLQSHWGSNYSVWRDRYFTVMGNPSKPNILSPQEDQVFQVGESVEVQWRRTDLVTSQYAAQVWCDWKLVAETGRVSSTWKNFESLPAGDCMVQVETYNQVGYSGWTQRLFKVRPEPPASPDIYHPTEGQAFHSRYTVLIGWHAIASAVEYNVELWGPNGLVESWIGTRELVLVAGHLPQGTYRVRIHSVDKYGQYQEWKDTTFITVDPTPTPINTAVPTATVTDTPVPTVTEAATATKVVPTSTSTPIPVPSNTATPLPPTATPIATVEGPAILSPTTQEIVYGTLFVLHYSEIEGAQSYQTELLNTQTNQSQFWRDYDTEGDFDPEIAYPEFGSYKWRVRAMLENNNYTDWSAWAAFNFQMPEEEQNIIFLPVVIR